MNRIAGTPTKGDNLQVTLTPHMTGSVTGWFTSKASQPDRCRNCVDLDTMERLPAVGFYEDDLETHPNANYHTYYVRFGLCADCVRSDHYRTGLVTYYDQEPK